jgi:C-terminal processing protease CtpA/Prc
MARGDLILAVDGRAVAELGLGPAIEAIRGPEGTRVLLRLQRGERTVELVVPRRLVRG